MRYRSMIRLGEHDTRTNPDCQLDVCAPPVQDLMVKQIRSHPQFNKPPFHNDIAIIELSAPVILNGKIVTLDAPFIYRILSLRHTINSMVIYVLLCNFPLINLYGKHDRSRCIF